MCHCHSLLTYNSQPLMPLCGFPLLCLLRGSGVVISDHHSICHIYYNIPVWPCWNVHKAKWFFCVLQHPSWVSRQILVHIFLERFSFLYSHFLDIDVRVFRHIQRHCATAAQWVCIKIIHWDYPCDKTIKLCCRKLDILTEVFISDITATFSFVAIFW